MAPRNPLGLKRKTHFLAKKHIDYFKDESGLVHVYRKGNGKLISVKPDVDGMFSVNGVWSHAAENKMAKVESRFWDLLQAFHAAPSALDQKVVSEYFSMWRARVEFARQYRDFEGPLAGITQRDLKAKVVVKIVDKENIEREVAVSAEDLLEYQGCGFYSVDVRASARSVSWPLILQRMDAIAQIIYDARIRWGAVTVQDATLVLPDRITSFDLPISSRWFLHGFRDDEDFAPVHTVPATTALQMNRDWFDDSCQVVVANSPEVLLALIPKV